MEPTKPDELKNQIKAEIQANGYFNSIEFANKNQLVHQDIVGALKSMEMAEIVVMSKDEKLQIELLDDGKFILSKGSHNIVLLKTLASNGNTLTKTKLIELISKEAFDRGFSVAMKQKQITFDKANDTVSIAQGATYNVDAVQNDLLEIMKDPTPTKENEKKLKDYKKDKVVREVKIVFWVAKKGPKFDDNRKTETDLTIDLLHNDKWKECNFKPYNFKAKGKEQNTGALHPILKVRSQYRQMLLELGFQEMPTNCFVESSFWNFDSLFQPQQHPARDSHDTFFLTNPRSSVVEPEIRDYFQRVKDVHERGGYGSLGWNYNWSEEEACKNILRTHTTAVSSKMLYRLAQEYKQTGVFRPTKLFSIDRVFRNESLDKTHLAEFHQIEGVVADRNIGLGHLMGTIDDFFSKMGIKRLKYKPTFNPYTEPSMEVYAWHEGLKKYVEIGNSGIFRPEMLLPMGLPEDVQVIAWGLSLERPAMINYGQDDIRELFGHGVKVSDTRKSSVYCLLNKSDKI